ncbi:MAG: hypothetical protein PHE55_10570, partial [Methylococcaceae bacterium]|nr:hypothetical protein [Methylococcaceae bacterium]
PRIRMVSSRNRKVSPITVRIRRAGARFQPIGTSLRPISAPGWLISARFYPVSAGIIVPFRREWRAPESINAT